MVSFIRVAEAPLSPEHILRPDSVTLKAPIYDPQKLICVGMNYVDHCTEQNYPVPEEPVIFSKFASAITDPNGAVLLPEETDVSSTLLSLSMMHVMFLSQSLDYEVELAFIISKRGKHITVCEATLVCVM